MTDRFIRLTEAHDNNERTAHLIPVRDIGAITCCKLRYSGPVKSRVEIRNGCALHVAETIDEIERRLNECETHRPKHCVSPQSCSTD